MQGSTTTTTTTKVAVCQICSTEDVGMNLKVSIDVIRDAVAAGAKACFLPEASDFIVSTTAACYDSSARLDNHPFVARLEQLAKELDVWIAVGIHELPGDQDTLAIQDESARGHKVYNTYVVIDGQGRTVQSYRKIHLFDVALQGSSDESDSRSDHPHGPASPIHRPQRRGESERMLAGDRIVPPVDMGPGIGPVGLEVCYDMRFPEMHQVLVEMGANTLVFPSAFTLKTGKDHWAVLCRAIAIQYQVYVLAPAQAGTHHSSRASWGESLAFSPWGEQLGRLESIDDFESRGGNRAEPMPSSFFIIEMDQAKISTMRDQIPLAFQKRHDIYDSTRAL